MNNRNQLYHGYRFPPEFISHTVWLYHRFCLSFRDVEDLLAKRGIIVSYETIRSWCNKFGPAYARTIKKRRNSLGDTWYMDEVYIVTDKLTSYAAARKTVMPTSMHCDDRYANNCAEVSHEHTRAQERRMRRFKSPGQVQRFLVVHSQVHNLFRIGRHLLGAANYRLLRNRSFETWQQVTCAC